MAEHFACVRAGFVDFAVRAERDGNACDDANSGPSRRFGRLGDTWDHVVADRPLVGHPQDGACGSLARDPQHRRPESRDEHRHLERVGDVHRAVHAIAVVVDGHRAGTGEGRIQHVEVVANQPRRFVVGQPELIGDDPVV